LPRIRPGAVVRCSLAVWLCCAAAASAGTSTAPNPVVTFSGPGTKQVSLQVCNSGGCNTTVQTIVVLDPNPAVVWANATPGIVTVGDVVHLAGVASGQPPLNHAWYIFNALGGHVASLPGATADWTANVPAGIYSVYFDVNNAHGTVTSAPIAVTVLPGPMIFSDGFELGSTVLWLRLP
jgi:PKD repeat protein